MTALPNASQPAIQTLLTEVDRLAQQRQEQLSRQQTGLAATTLRQMTQKLEQALDTSAALEPCLELRTALATELISDPQDAIIPWLTTNARIQAGLKELVRRNAQIKSQLDTGQTREAYAALVVLQKDILALKRDNDRAVAGQSIRQRYDALRSTVPERLRSASGFDTIDAFAKGGQEDWNGGSWDAAERGFGQATQKLSEWLEPQLTEAERQARESQLQADREAALREDVVRLSSERDKARSERDGLQTSLAALNEAIKQKDAEIAKEKARINALTGEKSTLNEQLALLNTERDRVLNDLQKKDQELIRQMAETDRWKDRTDAAGKLIDSLPTASGGDGSPGATQIIIDAGKIAAVIEARLKSLDTSDRAAAQKALAEAILQWQANENAVQAARKERESHLKTNAEDGAEVVEQDRRIQALVTAGTRLEDTIRQALARLDQPDRHQFDERETAIRQFMETKAKMMGPPLKRLANHPDVIAQDQSIAKLKREQEPFAAGAARAAGTGMKLTIEEIIALSGATTPGRTIIDPDGMEFVVITPGEFLMGSPDSDYLASSDEKPQHRVRITKTFAAGKFECTRGQFAAFVKDSSYVTDAEKGEGGYGLNASTGQWSRSKDYSWRNPGFLQTDEHPVVNVSHNDAVAYLAWRGRKYGKTYRLPTEAEFEYMNRAGTTTRYASGSDDAESVVKIGNIADGTAKAQFSGWTTINASDGYVFTAPVGKFAPNGFGLHDTTGNAWEHCSDGYKSDYYQQFAEKLAIDPTGPAEVSAGSSRCVRGASFDNSPKYSRAGYRYDNAPTSSDDIIGFRVVLGLG